MLGWKKVSIVLLPLYIYMIYYDCKCDGELEIRHIRSLKDHNINRKPFERMGRPAKKRRDREPNAEAFWFTAKLQGLIPRRGEGSQLPF